MKRAKDIKVGDSIFPKFSIKPYIINVETVEVTRKGRIHINKGMGHWREKVFEAEQWVYINPQ